MEPLIADIMHYHGTRIAKPNAGIPYNAEGSAEGYLSPGEFAMEAAGALEPVSSAAVQRPLQPTYGAE